MSTLTAAVVTSVKEAVQAVFDEKLAALDARVLHLQRIKAESPAESATEESVDDALAEASDYMSTLGVEVS